MEGSTDPPSADRVIALLEENAIEEARSCLSTMETDTASDRKETLRSLRSLAEDRPAMVGPLCSTLTSFLGDEERSVRLTTAKLFVTIAATEPTHVRSVVDALANRLADDREFYYVRARCAEALGYVALEHPEEVASPELLADLRVGLSFDEPEVKEKLAKALEYVALGDPGRLRHQVSSLAEHLDDENELVRYHLCTALVVIGCEYPAKLAATTDALATRLADEDENPYVRGRVAEALGVLARDRPEAVPQTVDEVPSADDDAASFLVDRLRFVRRMLAGDASGEAAPDGVGTVEGVRRTTEDAVAEITAPDGDGECPHCGLVLPEHGPPMCPRCGAPY